MRCVLLREGEPVAVWTPVSNSNWDAGTKVPATATALLCGLLLPVTAACASEPESAGRGPLEASRKPAVAIMGEVARPAVFELSLPQVRLLDLVILAGGSTQ